MITTDLSWEKNHPSLLIPRLKVFDHEADNPIIPQLVLHIRTTPQEQQRAEPPLTETEQETYLKLKASVCISVSRLILGALGTPQDMEDQAFDLMHLPIDQLLSISERLTRLKGIK